MRLLKPQEQGLPDDLVESGNASYAYLPGLAPGSREVQEAQRRAEAKQKEEEEARRKADATRKAEEEAQRQAEARQQAEKEAQRQAEAKRKAEEEDAQRSARGGSGGGPGCRAGVK